MFGKLIKNEFRGTWKFMVTIFAAFALLTVFGGISVRILSTSEHTGALPVLTVILYGMSFFVVFFGILIYLSNRYYKTMYSTQGYLTHTLPASENSIFSAKALVSTIWMLAGILLMICSVYTMIDIGTKGEMHREVKHLWDSTGVTVDEDGTHVQVNNDGIIVEDGDTHVSITPHGIIVDDGDTNVIVGGSGHVEINGRVIDSDSYSNSFDDAVASQLQKHPRRTFWLFCLWILINMILGSAVLLLWLFASMAIGQLSDKHRTLVSILAGIGFYILNQILGVSAIINFVTRIDFLDPYHVFQSVTYGAPLCLLGMGAVLSAICLVINHKKLNLA